MAQQLLSGNTGQNDPNSIYGTKLLNSLNSWGQLAGNVYNQVTNKPAASPAPAPAAPAAPAPAASPSWQKYLPWAIGAGVLLLIVGLMFRK